MKDIFISYSRDDMEIADEICAAFENAEISYFIDIQDIGIGHPFAEIAKAIKECTLFLYLGSEYSYNSIFVNKELNYAIKHKEKNSILPYLIDETPMPDELDLLLCDYNWRTKKEHPVTPMLVDDISKRLGRKKGNYNKEKQSHLKEMYSISLVSSGICKLQVVKDVKELFGLGLKEAKDIVDAAPNELPGLYPLNDANRIKEVLEKSGAKVNIVSRYAQPSNMKEDKCYIEIQSSMSSDIKIRDIMTRLTPFGIEEILKYLSSTPCILPFLLDTEIAARLKEEADKTNTKIRLIPYTQNNSAVEFKMLTAGTAKLQVVKYVKESLNMGIKEAKDLVDSAPVVIASTKDFENTMWFVKGLKECGAVLSIELK